MLLCDVAKLYLNEENKLSISKIIDVNL